MYICLHNRLMGQTVEACSRQTVLSCCLLHAPTGHSLRPAVIWPVDSSSFSYTVKKALQEMFTTIINFRNLYLHLWMGT